MKRVQIIVLHNEGHRPSGVGSFCRTLLGYFKEALLFTYGGVCEEPWSENEWIIPSELEGNPEGIADWALGRITDLSLENDLYILPNVGETSYRIAILLARAIGEGKLSKPRIVGICHSDDSNQYYMLDKYRDFLSGGFAVSEHIENELIRRRFPNGSIRKLRYPIEVSGLSESRLSLTDRLPRIIYFGRLEIEQKRVDRLIPLIKMLAEEGLKFSFEVAGSGSFESELRKGFDRMDLPEEVEVKFLGAVDSHGGAKLLGAADLQVSVSEYEGTPISILEGMARGACSVVMNMDSGIPEIIEHGVTGWIVPQGDIPAMAQQIIKVVDEPEKLARVLEDGRTFILENHEVNLSLKKFMVDLETLKSVTTNGEMPPMEMQKFLNYLSEKFTKLRGWKVAIWGAGEIGVHVMSILNKAGITIEALVDGNHDKWGLYYGGHPCESPGVLAENSPDVLVIASSAHEEAIRDEIQKLISLNNLRVIGPSDV